MVSERSERTLVNGSEWNEWIIGEMNEVNGTNPIHSWMNVCDVSIIGKSLLLGR